MAVNTTVQVTLPQRDLPLVQGTIVITAVMLVLVNLITEVIYPLVDPRGLVTPLYDGWSIDFWLVGDDGTLLVPSTIPSAPNNSAPLRGVFRVQSKNALCQGGLR